MIKVELISTGDEVITGMIDDTNASWLCQELLDLGIQVQRRSTIGDNLDDLVEILKERSLCCDVIIFNGGLGPTTDDCTTEAVCKALGVKSILIPSWLEHIKTWHKSRNRPMPVSNEKQAYIPQGSTLINNSCGTACGYMVKINKALCFFTPGVPSEVKAMFKDEIKPYLKNNLLNDSQTQVKRLFTFGISESLLQDKISTLNFPLHIVIGYRAYYPTIELKIIAHGASELEFTEAIDKLKKLCADYIYAEDSDDIQSLIKNKISDSSIAIFDNVSTGILGVALNQKIANMSVFATMENFKESYLAELNFKNYDFCIILKNKKDQDGVDIDIYNNKLNKKYAFFANINVSVILRKKYAYALLAQILFLQLLEYGKIAIKPDNTQLIELN